MTRKLKDFLEANSHLVPEEHRTAFLALVTIEDAKALLKTLIKEKV